MRARNLLPSLYGQVIIPAAVQRELVELIPHDPAYDVTTHGWVEIRDVCETKETVALLQRGLDLGESEAITLARELSADLLLIDERKGSRVADEFGLAHVGLLGVLITAKHKALLKEIRSILTCLRNEIGFWISDEVFEHVLDLSGEK